MKALADTVDIVIGIDPHKHTHTAAIVAAVTGKKLASCTLHARPSGFSELMRIAVGNCQGTCRLGELTHAAFFTLS